jgi:hypothetical protein
MLLGCSKRVGWIEGFKCVPGYHVSGTPAPTRDSALTRAWSEVAAWDRDMLRAHGRMIRNGVPSIGNESKGLNGFG